MLSRKILSGHHTQNRYCPGQTGTYGNPTRHTHAHEKKWDNSDNTVRLYLQFYVSRVHNDLWSKKYPANAIGNTTEYNNNNTHGYSWGWDRYSGCSASDGPSVVFRRPEKTNNVIATRLFRRCAPAAAAMLPAWHDLR